MSTDIATKDDLRTEIVTTQFDILKWIIMAFVAQGGLIVAPVKLL